MAAMCLGTDHMAGPKVQAMDPSEAQLSSHNSKHSHPEIRGFLWL
jgi:hypothetical protein